MGFQFQFSIPAFRAFRAAATRTERDAEKLRTRARARACGRMHSSRSCLRCDGCEIARPYFRRRKRAEGSTPRYFPLRRESSAGRHGVVSPSRFSPSSPAERGVREEGGGLFAWRYSEPLDCPLAFAGFGLISRNDWPERRKIVVVDG